MAMRMAPCSSVRQRNKAAINRNVAFHVNMCAHSYSKKEYFLCKHEFISRYTFIICGVKRSSTSGLLTTIRFAPRYAATEAWNTIIVSASPWLHC